MNDVLRIARLKIALQRAFLGRAILIFTDCGGVPKSPSPVLTCSPFLCITPPHFAYLPTSSKFTLLLWPSKFVLTNDRDANFYRSMAETMNSSIVRFRGYFLQRVSK